MLFERNSIICSISCIQKFGKLLGQPKKMSPLQYFIVTVSYVTMYSTVVISHIILQKSVTTMHFEKDYFL